MDNTRFRVGQIVQYSHLPIEAVETPPRQFKILRLLQLGNEYAYCIKTITEASEHVVGAAEIELATPFKTNGPCAMSMFGHLSVKRQPAGIFAQ